MATSIESEEGNLQPINNELSPRNKLYMKINENLSESEVESLRMSMITDKLIARGRVQKAKPHEIFNMLEDDGRMGVGNLLLLKDLLRQLNKGKLAEEADDVEKMEVSNMNKRNAPEDLFVHASPKHLKMGSDDEGSDHSDSSAESGIGCSASPPLDTETQDSDNVEDHASPTEDKTDCSKITTVGDVYKRIDYLRTKIAKLTRYPKSISQAKTMAYLKASKELDYLMQLLAEQGTGELRVDIALMDTQEEFQDRYETGALSQTIQKEVKQIMRSSSDDIVNVKPDVSVDFSQNTTESTNCSPERRATIKVTAEDVQLEDSCRLDKDSAVRQLFKYLVKNPKKLHPIMEYLNSFHVQVRTISYGSIDFECICLTPESAVHLHQEYNGQRLHAQFQRVLSSLAILTEFGIKSISLAVQLTFADEGFIMDHHSMRQKVTNAPVNEEARLSPEQRPRTQQKLIPWLRQRVSSGQVPGVEWVDEPRGVVKIQWPRKSQHDYNVNQDGAIFKEWAVHTGMYTEGVDTPDPSRWETNFRCVMNESTEAEYLRDQSQEQGDSPYRVYRLSPSSADDASQQQLVSHVSPVLDEDCELQIEPYYGSDMVFRTKPSHGCLIHPPSFQRNGFHVPAKLVVLSEYTGGNAHKQKQYNRIFNHLDKGIAARVFNNDLYVTRHCRVRVLCRMVGGKVVKLKKGAKTKVFDYGNFLAVLQDYARTGLTHQRPETQVYLNIGQNDPGPPNSQALITVVLRHVTAEQRLRTVDDSLPNMGQFRKPHFERVPNMAHTSPSNLYLRISQNLKDNESRDFHNYVESKGILPARDLPHMNPNEIGIKLEHKKLLWAGEPTVLEDVMTKIGRVDFAEEAKQIAARQKKGVMFENMPFDEGAGSSAKRPKLSPDEGTMDAPIKLTSTRMVNNRRQIYISPEAERIISNLQPRPVDVVAVVGPMRKGKSHLANLLCKRKSGFPLGDEMESKTKDFWFWIGPHPVKTNRYLMVVDTEGLGDYSDEEQNEKDIKCLVLATLLSNHLVFNLQDNPYRSFVSQLRLMGDLAEHVRVQKDGNDGGNNLGHHFPELWVTVQDARLKPPQRDGMRLTPDEFLEVMLERKDGHTKSIRSHNEITDAVKAFFPKRHLRLIPAPSIDSDILSNLDKVGDNVLQTDYKDAVSGFTGEIWNSGQVKKVNGDDIKTTGLLHIMRYYVNAINDPNALPSVFGDYEAMAEGECSRASDEQLKAFQETVEKTVKPLMPTDEEICNREIQTATDTAVSRLSADVGKWDKVGTWKKRLQGKLETERLALINVNSAKSKDFCEAIIKEVDQPVRQKVGKGEYNRIGGFNTYVREMDVVYSAYRQKASGKGPAIENVLQTFRTTETTRRDTIRDTDGKLVEEDRRIKEEQRKKQEAKAAAERAAEKERLARAEAARAEEAKKRAEAERAAEKARRQAAQQEAAKAAEARKRAKAEKAVEEAKRRTAEAQAEAARHPQRAAEERARRKRRGKFLGLF
ncbi:uncharacterized protein LOC118429564 isoform X2 [Branchiostoma floridae]|uniref:Uncharacterized protein LOC118429564 isoform X2 n=1 Tax=Branchiostoma floridae TaxID=7739 RepID=A0A9J7MB55_BRAFL|nr:uncharacterized protein LOC118429564 isoform X2 [Branchiostoma floridae]